MASAEKLKSGWRGVYYVRGQKCHTPAPHHARKRDAIDAAEAARVIACRQAAREKKTLSPNLAWGEWWDLLSKKRVFDDTETGYLEAQLVERYLRPRWAETPLNEIRKKDVQDWVDALVDGTAERNLLRDVGAKSKLSPSYIRKIYGVLTVSINHAVDDEVLGASPCVNISLPKVPKRAQPYISVGAQEKIGEELRGDYKDALDFALETGLRPGELCGLHIFRLDLDSGWMQVSEVFVRRLRVIRPCPKDQDMRLVPLSDRALEIAARRAAGRARTTCGIPHTDGSCESDVLFRTDRGMTMSQNIFGEHMRRASIKAGLGRRSPYATRRGAATLMAAGGMDAYELARIFGWADINEAWHYVQQTPNARSRAMAALEAGRARELRVLPGGLGRSGMSSGTNLHLMVSDDTGRPADGKAI